MTKPDVAAIKRKVLPVVKKANKTLLTLRSKSKFTMMNTKTNDNHNKIKSAIVNHTSPNIRNIILDFEKEFDVEFSHYHYADPYNSCKPAMFKNSSHVSKFNAIRRNIMFHQTKQASIHNYEGHIFGQTSQV